MAELFRVLGDAGRLRVLALCAAEELSVGELAEALDESQPQVSRRSAPLRDLGLLEARREGTRTYLKTLLGDRAVVVEAVAEGRRLCEADGSLARLPLLVAARAEPSLQFFDDDDAGDSTATVAADDPSPVLAHLAALGPLLPERRLAIDVGCGDGFLLDVLAPLYERVIAVDRSPAQLARCARRVRERGYAHVRLYNGPFDDTELFRQVDEQGGADLVYASRLLHHVPQPARAVGAFCRLLRPGGHLVLLDYLPHEDEDMRQQGDVWLGFTEEDLGAPCLAAGLEVLAHHPIPDAWHPNGADKHLRWQALIARRPNRPG